MFSKLPLETILFVNVQTPYAYAYPLKPLENPLLSPQIKICDVNRKVETDEDCKFQVNDVESNIKHISFFPEYD